MTGPVLFIGVNYRNTQAALEYAKGVRALSGGAQADIIIADNSDCFAPAKRHAQRVELDALGVTVVSTNNPGYYPGANAALQAYRRQHVQPRYVIVSNTDLAVESSDFIAQLDGGDRPACAMVIAPAIVDNDGIDQNPMRLEPYTAAQFDRLAFIMSSAPIYFAYELAAATKRKLLGRRRPSATPAPGPVYMAHGSFLVFTTSYFAKTAGLAFPAFLYEEEIFVAEEVRRASGTIWYDPALRIRHQGGQTTAALGREQRRRYVHASLLRLKTLYFSGTG